jgi:hypothetical protein
MKLELQRYGVALVYGSPTVRMGVHIEHTVFFSIQDAVEDMETLEVSHIAGHTLGNTILAIVPVRNAIPVRLAFALAIYALDHRSAPVPFDNECNRRANL